MRVKKALQGHPESPRLWAQLIDKIIQNLGFTPCHHEPCLYVNKSYNGNLVYFLRQVDDFAVSSSSVDISENVIEAINSKLSIQIKSLGTIHRFNGVDIDQTRNYIKVYNQRYIEKILADKNWLDASIPNNTYATHIPMHHDNEFNKNIEEATPIPITELSSVEKEMGFTYRQGIGELLYALIMCRPDISYPVIKLSQYSTRPARIHFEAVRGIYQYLKTTRDQGIHFWRQQPRADLPLTPDPVTYTDYHNYEPHESKSTANASTMDIHVDASYANDSTHRKSVTGIIARLAGGTILYKTTFQAIVALSSTEAEFIAACEAGKHSLYIRSILEDVGLEQTEATIVYEDNQGAIAMANAGKPTKRTRHIDTRHFAILSWVEQDLLTLKRIPTGDNSSDSMTKNTPKILFNRHKDHIMGFTKPTYVDTYTVQTLHTQILPALSKGG